MDIKVDDINGEYDRLVAIAKAGDEARAKLVLLDCQARTRTGWYMIERAKLFRLKSAIQLQRQVFAAIEDKYKKDWAIHQALKYEGQDCYGDEWSDEGAAATDYWAFESVQRLSSIIDVGTYFAQHCSGPDYIEDCIEPEEEFICDENG